MISARQVLLWPTGRILIYSDSLDLCALCTSLRQSRPHHRTTSLPPPDRRFRVSVYVFVLAVGNGSLSLLLPICQNVSFYCH